ncbi:MAG: hypothetical protein IJZ68_08630 [Bacteroidaceae bacterium]|nr:hypothetical protein [Bacteroidaceae bacterium]
MVKLASKAELKSYAQQEYGSAEFVREENTETSRTCYFQDREYGFEYYVTSYKSAVGLDATTFWYQEVKRSNFESEYCQAVWARLDLSEVPTNVTVECAKYVTDSVDIIGYITIPDKFSADIGADVAMNLGKQIMVMDNRDVLENTMIILQDANEHWIGRFDFAENKYISEEMANRSYYHRRAQEIMRCEDVMLTESEMMRMEDVPGLSEENIANVLGSDYSIVTCYYFLSGHKKYFIADVCVMYDNGPHQYIYNVTDGHSMTPYLDPYDPHKR